MRQCRRRHSGPACGSAHRFRLDRRVFLNIYSSAHGCHLHVLRRRRRNKLAVATLPARAHVAFADAHAAFAAFSDAGFIILIPEFRLARRSVQVLHSRFRGKSPRRLSAFAYQRRQIASGRLRSHNRLRNCFHPRSVPIRHHPCSQVFESIHATDWPARLRFLALRHVRSIFNTSPPEPANIRRRGADRAGSPSRYLSMPPLPRPRPYLDRWRCGAFL